jgi:uncharacterized membrane protein
MKSIIYSLFANYADLIIFLHVISAVIWVGGMIAMRFAAHYSFVQIEDPAARLQRTAYALKRLFTLVAPFIVILLVTAVIMIIGFGFKNAAADAANGYAVHMYEIVRIKEVIWGVMTLNYLAMVVRRNKAEKLIQSGNLPEAKAKLSLIGQYMVPVNIGLGLIAIYLGVYLSLSK